MSIAPAVRWQSLRRLQIGEPVTQTLGRAAVLVLVAVLAFLAGWGQLAFQVLELRQQVDQYQRTCRVPG